MSNKTREIEDFYVAISLASWITRSFNQESGMLSESITSQGGVELGSNFEGDIKDRSVPTILIVVHKRNSGPNLKLSR